MRKLNLGDGFFATVDDEDFERLNQYSWYLKEKRSSQYAVRFITKTKSVYLHHEILKSVPGMVVDHVDGNGLNNSRSNLRPATRQQNAQNARKSANRSSVFKGVHFHKPTQKWVARIGVNYKRIPLGYFDNEIEAAKAYDNKAKELFGEFACLNFPEVI